MAKTKEQIKEQARELFNLAGVNRTTLRNVAEAMDRSYGNITYHFPGKPELILELYRDWVRELSEAMHLFGKREKLLETMLLAPNFTFELSMKYLFLQKDYVDLIRNFPELAKESRENQEARMEFYLGLLKEIQEQGFLQPELEDEDLIYLMELSGAMRTFFFLRLAPPELNAPDLKSRYLTTINKLFFPYLSGKGRKVYKQVMEGLTGSG